MPAIDDEMLLDYQYIIQQTKLVPSMIMIPQISIFQIMLIFQDNCLSTLHTK